MKALRVAQGDLTSHGRLLEPHLRAAIQKLPPSTRRVAEYHFGWLDEHGETSNLGHGKGLRASLTLAAATAVGEDPPAAIAPAVAVELVHNFSLIQDDLMDGDEVRRYRPAVWAVFGPSTAVLCGDALLALAFEILAESRAPFAIPAIHLLSGTVRTMIDGQQADLSEGSTAGLGECLDIARRKTGMLFGCASALGAVFGGGTSQQVDALLDFGVHLGVAFQLADDIAALWGNMAVTGKPLLSDLRNRRMTFPVAAALTSETPAGQALREWWRNRNAPPSSDTGPWVAGLIASAAGRARSEAQIDECRRDAFEALDAAGLGSGTAALRNLANAVLDHRTQPARRATRGRLA